MELKKEKEKNTHTYTNILLRKLHLISSYNKSSVQDIQAFFFHLKLRMLDQFKKYSKLKPLSKSSSPSLQKLQHFLKKPHVY